MDLLSSVTKGRVDRQKAKWGGVDNSIELNPAQNDKIVGRISLTELRANRLNHSVENNRTEFLSEQEIVSVQKNRNTTYSANTLKNSVLKEKVQEGYLDSDTKAILIELIERVEYLEGKLK